MNKKILIVIGMAIIGLSIGTTIGLEQIKHSQTAIADEPNNNAQEQSAGQKITPEQVLAQYNQTRTAEQRNEAMAKIKSIFGQDLTITFKEAKTRYYTYGIPDPAMITDFVQLKAIEVYEDNKGFITEVDTASNEILNRAKDCTYGTTWITADQAKEVSQNLLAKLVPDPENYRLRQEDAFEKTYYTDWAKTHEGDFYNLIPGGKGQSLSKSEWRTIVICDLSGELSSYEYKPALTEKEITEMAQKWGETQKKNIEALRKFLNTPDKQFTFVNYLGCSECGEGGTANFFRVYKDENGYCYDIDPNGNITPDTEVFGQCKTPKL